jgi:hypothetical protein
MLFSHSLVRQHLLGSGIGKVIRPYGFNIILLSFTGSTGSFFQHLQGFLALDTTNLSITLIVVIVLGVVWKWPHYLLDELGRGTSGRLPLW